MRLNAQHGERIDRGRPLTFFFDDETVEGFAGDSVASALFASGRRVFSRSFKYHRPRGLYCCSGSCPNCLMEVDGVPNVRACVEPARQGAVVRAQNVLPTLEWDLLSIVDKVGGPFTPVGFYYRTMIRPRRAWPLYERVLRNAAGLGKIDKEARRSATAASRRSRRPARSGSTRAASSRSTRGTCSIASAPTGSSSRPARSSSRSCFRATTSSG